MLEKSSIFLFPETIQTNPNLFDGKAVQVSTDEVKVNGFKIYCLIDKLSLNETPFTVVAVRSQRSVATFYQYNFPQGMPDFHSLGFETLSMQNGKVLFMTKESFIKVTVNSRYETIKSGNWADVSKRFYELTAFYQLDVIPQLSLNIFKDPSYLEKYSAVFHKLYDVQEVQKVDLYSLFNDISSLLFFFGFIKQKKVCNEYCCSFAPLIEPFTKYMEQCFDGMFISDSAITPGAVKQLRSLFKFVKLSLGKIGYEVPQTEDVYFATTISLNKFQRDNNIKDSYCSQKTLLTLLASVLSLNKNPAIALQGTGLDITLDKNDKEYFGPIDTKNMDEVAKRFATGVSRAVSKLTSPSVYINEIENDMIQISMAGAENIEKVNAASSVIDEKIFNIKRMASNVKEEAEKSLKNAKVAERSLYKLEEIGKEIDKRMEDVKENLQKEMKKSNTVVIILFLLICIFIWQRLGANPLPSPSQLVKQIEEIPKDVITEI